MDIWCSVQVEFCIIMTITRWPLCRNVSNMSCQRAALLDCIFGVIHMIAHPLGHLINRHLMFGTSRVCITAAITRRPLCRNVSNTSCQRAALLDRIFAVIHNSSSSIGHLINGHQMFDTNSVCIAKETQSGMCRNVNAMCRNIIITLSMLLELWYRNNEFDNFFPKMLGYLKNSWMHSKLFCTHLTDFFMLNLNITMQI